MFQRLLFILLIFSSLTLVQSCGEYQRVLKSTDSAYKLEMAKKYYEEKEYAKALPLFEELMNIYRGTPKAPEVYYLYAYTYFGEQNFLLAAFHFKNFSKTFRTNEHAEECAFMSAKCYFLDSPRPTLEQSNTYKAMEELQLFINTNPNSKFIPECNEMMAELRLKLEEKSMKIAKQYFITGEYKAAIIAYNNTLSEFPDTKKKEEINFMQLKASVELAKASVQSKKLQRLKEAQAMYSTFKRTFPESEYREEADKLNENLNKLIEEITNA